MGKLLLFVRSGRLDDEVHDQCEDESQAQLVRGSHAVPCRHEAVLVALLLLPPLPVAAASNAAGRASAAASAAGPCDSTGAADVASLGAAAL